ncbi:unnamed protein product [Vitrella brassicaformis CCMP3155]|uniref:Magnesium transporter MgtE intracellular domain-containing protein n=2 Tax=Vitrella brassicaformis TaxID=1169539 RepID=A0A0G4EQV0_VITBC|nr:unnamed protein product [Vitrella brassicaformis CCMP3155]|eukprot:CEL99853.1 unnamed protein product [Vitrella brassicaformis CCMP3155]
MMRAAALICACLVSSCWAQLLPRGRAGEGILGGQKRIKESRKVDMAKWGMPGVKIGIDEMIKNGPTFNKLKEIAELPSDQMFDALASERGQRLVSSLFENLRPQTAGDIVSQLLTQTTPEQAEQMVETVMEKLEDEETPQMLEELVDRLNEEQLQDIVATFVERVPSEPIAEFAKALASIDEEKIEKSGLDPEKLRPILAKLLDSIDDEDYNKLAGAIEEALPPSNLGGVLAATLPSLQTNSLLFERTLRTIFSAEDTLERSAPATADADESKNPLERTRKILEETLLQAPSSTGNKVVAFILEDSKLDAFATPAEREEFVKGLIDDIQTKNKTLAGELRELLDEEDTDGKTASILSKTNSTTSASNSTAKDEKR